jgi:hypothetical protein
LASRHRAPIGVTTESLSKHGDAALSALVALAEALNINDVRVSSYECALAERDEHAAADMMRRQNHDVAVLRLEQSHRLATSRLEQLKE